MKSGVGKIANGISASLPSVGAWVEIIMAIQPTGRKKSLPSVGAWVEITMAQNYATNVRSLPSVGAWVEIKKFGRVVSQTSVAPFGGSVG